MNAKSFFWFGVFGGALLAMPAFGAGSESLYRLFDGKLVKVYLADVKDSSQTHEVDPKIVKGKLEEALKNRKSIRFQTVDRAEQADLSIETDLKGFFWTDHDPVDMLIGVGAAAMDAAVQEDYARLEADFAVTDVRAHKVLWQNRLTGSVTKKPMPKPDSVPLASEALAKTFLKECFSKKKSAA